MKGLGFWGIRVKGLRFWVLGFRAFGYVPTLHVPLSSSYVLLERLKRPPHFGAHAQILRFQSRPSFKQGLP